MTHPKLLIEEWLPIETLSAEQTREKSMGKNSFPAPVRLHVWWARRPLLVSRAAILASVMPAWSEHWPEQLRLQFPDQKSYKNWFLKACGILGDPVEGRKFIQWAIGQGKFVPNPYLHPRAYTVSPESDTIKTMGDLMNLTWGQRNISLIDPFSGGGSIPFEALRYGFHTHANELNPVASVVLKATLDYPFKYGQELSKEISRFGKELVGRVQERLKPYFSDLSGTPEAQGAAYLWARTVACPYTGKPIPLSTNWWLEKKAKPAAIKPIFESGAPEATFVIFHGKEECIKAAPDKGTIKGGDAISPWANDQIVGGDYIKKEAQEGRMGKQMIAVGVKRRGGFDFRPPVKADIDANILAEEEFAKRAPKWDSEGMIPREAYPEDANDQRPTNYGMPTWGHFFSERQLLSLCTFLEILREMSPRIMNELGDDRGKATITYLAIALDKAVNYNSVQGFWDYTRRKIAHAFSRHDFAFRWGFAEFDGAINLFPWALEQAVDAYDGLVKLTQHKTGLIEGSKASNIIKITRGNASKLITIENNSIEAIIVDPPYHDNVMYAELSDFFYVWMKRSIGYLYPEFFTDGLTNKDDEAVANIARFADLGRKKKQLATQDYERKMSSAFQEMHRILKEDGVLTVMFTHKKVEAWDTLATSLIGAGFAVRASWPVHTESERSLHQAKKNAAASTILLTCRKRDPQTETVWWEDLKPMIRQVAREKAAEFEAMGIRGVDLYISTFGPVLQVLSERWPVLSGELDDRGNPKSLRPEVALDLAREEVINLRKRGLLLGRALSFDPATDWYLMAWDAFQAAEFPGDEARKLALSLGMDLEREIVAEKRLVAKKSNTVVIQEPKARLKKGMVDPDLPVFHCVIDAVHTAMVVDQEEGATPCEAFLKRTGLAQEPTFKACLQALLNAIPRTRSKGKFNRIEAQLLEDLRLAFFDDLIAPKEEEPKPIVIPSHLSTEDGENWMEDEDEENDGEGEE